MPKTVCSTPLLCLAWGTMLIVSWGAMAPHAAGQVFQAAPANAVPAQLRGNMVIQPTAQPPQPQPPKQKPDNDKKDKNENKESKDNEEKQDSKDNSKSTVERSNEPPRAPDPRELDAKPDEHGRVRFSFHGQPWPDVLQWLANVSELSLDWRELPNDYLNLTTQRSYTLAEARDLINRHLQARGYALLLSGEVLSVFKLDKIDPSLVPRVSEDELYDRQPYDIVKITFDLPEGLDPAKAVEDVKQALSPHAKAMPLAATKRVLLIDSVANLRMVSALLNDERLEIEGHEVPREFILKHVQASEVIDILYVVLGLDPNSRPSQMDLQLQQKKLELLQQIAQRGKDVAKMLQPDGPKVYLAFNKQRNSVLANAPPEQMAIIQRTIKSLDVSSSGESLAEVSTLRTLKRYRLKAINPDSLLSTLEEIGELSPLAELRADNASKTFFARCNAEDHEKIAALVEELDSSDLRVVVFQLRRYPADAVAGSVAALLIKPPEKKKNDRPRFFFWGNDDDNEEEPKTELRVDADTENNRLIVRGTEQQLAEVRDLLIQLGEPLDEPPRGGRVRVIGALSPKETQKLINQLRDAWPSVGSGTELVLPPAEAEAPEEETTEETTRDSTASSNPKQQTFQLLTHSNEQALSSEQENADQDAVVLSVDAQGRIVITSDNTEALNQLEELVVALAPAPQRFEVFPVKNLRADYIVEMLEVYYEEEVKAGKGEEILDWWGRIRDTGPKDDGGIRLSKRRRLRFLSEQTSNTVLVANASVEMLAEIDRLIKAWDKPPIDDAILSRRTEAIRVQYSKASSIAKALKEVYRDLLSRGDKEFDTEEKKARGADRRLLTSIKYSDGTEYKSTEPIYIGFDGVLSIGADDSANVLVVSASSEIFDSVVEMIRTLDEEARPTETVRVVQIEGALSPQALEKVLDEAYRQPDQSSRNGRDRDSNEELRRREEERRRGRR